MDMLVNKVSKRTLYFQMKIVVAYLIFTLFLYVVGPFAWVTYSPVVFWTLNITYILVFIIGWHIGIRNKSATYIWREYDDNRELLILKYLITVNFVYELLNAYRRVQARSVSISGLITSIMTRASNMGASYNEYIEVTSESSDGFGGTIGTYFLFFIGFFAFNITIMGVVYFKKLSKYNKVMVILTYTVIIGQFLAIGTNIGIFRIILIFVVLYGISVAKGRYTKVRVKRKRTRRQKIRLLSLTIAGVVGVLVLFDKTMQSRGGILFWQTSVYNVGGIGIDRDSVLFKVLPPTFHMLLVSISSYLCQGYYGMSLSLRVPWAPCYGMGYSRALQGMLRDYIPVIYENSYQYRVQQFGWKEGVQWHTMYSWFANDVSYVGVILIMFLIGLLFASAYKESLTTNNPYAKMLIYYMAQLAFFIPCNNQLFQATYIMFPFIINLILWIVTRSHRIVINV